MDLKAEVLKEQSEVLVLEESVNLEEERVSMDFTGVTDDREELVVEDICVEDVGEDLNEKCMEEDVSENSVGGSVNEENAGEYLSEGNVEEMLDVKGPGDDLDEEILEDSEREDLNEERVGKDLKEKSIGEDLNEEIVEDLDEETLVEDFEEEILDVKGVGEDLDEDILEECKREDLNEERVGEDLKEKSDGKDLHQEILEEINEDLDEETVGEALKKKILEESIGEDSNEEAVGEDLNGEMLMEKVGEISNDGSMEADLNEKILVESVGGGSNEESVEADLNVDILEKSEGEDINEGLLEESVGKDSGKETAGESLNVEIVGGDLNEGTEEEDLNGGKKEESEGKDTNEETVGEPEGDSSIDKIIETGLQNLKPSIDKDEKDGSSEHKENFNSEKCDDGEVEGSGKKHADEALKKKYEQTSGLKLKTVQVALDRLQLSVDIEYDFDVLKFPLAGNNGTSSCSEDETRRKKVRQRQTRRMKMKTDKLRTVDSYVSKISKKGWKRFIKKRTVFAPDLRSLYERSKVFCRRWKMTSKPDSTAKKAPYIKGLAPNTDGKVLSNFGEQVMKKLQKCRARRMQRCHTSFQHFLKDFINPESYMYDNRPFSERFVAEVDKTDKCFVDNKEGSVINDGILDPDNYIDPYTGKLVGNCSEPDKDLVNTEKENNKDKGYAHTSEELNSDLYSHLSQHQVSNTKLEDGKVEEMNTQDTEQVEATDANSCFKECLNFGKEHSLNPLTGNVEFTLDQDKRESQKEIKEISRALGDKKQTSIVSTGALDIDMKSVNINRKEMQYIKVKKKLFASIKREVRKALKLAMRLKKCENSGGGLFQHENGKREHLSKKCIETMKSMIIFDVERNIISTLEETKQLNQFVMGRFVKDIENIEFGIQAITEKVMEKLQEIMYDDKKEKGKQKCGRKQIVSFIEIVNDVTDKILDANSTSYMAWKEKQVELAEVTCKEADWLADVNRREQLIAQRRRLSESKELDIDTDVEFQEKVKKRVETAHKQTQSSAERESKQIEKPVEKGKTENSVEKVSEQRKERNVQFEDIVRAQKAFKAENELEKLAWKEAERQRESNIKEQAIAVRKKILAEMDISNVDADCTSCSKESKSSIDQSDPNEDQRWHLPGQNTGDADSAKLDHEKDIIVTKIKEEPVEIEENNGFHHHFNEKFEIKMEPQGDLQGDVVVPGKMEPSSEISFEVDQRPVPQWLIQLNKDRSGFTVIPTSISVDAELPVPTAARYSPASCGDGDCDGDEEKETQKSVDGKSSNRPGRSKKREVPVILKKKQKSDSVDRPPAAKSPVAVLMNKSNLDKMTERDTKCFVKKLAADLSTQMKENKVGTIIGPFNYTVGQPTPATAQTQLPVGDGPQTVPPPITAAPCIQGVLRNFFQPAAAGPSKSKVQQQLREPSSAVHAVTHKGYRGNAFPEDLNKNANNGIRNPVRQTVPTPSQDAKLKIPVNLNTNVNTGTKNPVKQAASTPSHGTNVVFPVQLDSNAIIGRKHPPGQVVPTPSQGINMTIPVNLNFNANSGIRNPVTPAVSSPSQGINVMLNSSASNTGTVRHAASPNTVPLTLNASPAAGAAGEAFTVGGTVNVPVVAPGMASLQLVQQGTGQNLAMVVPSLLPATQPVLVSMGNSIVGNVGNVGGTNQYRYVLVPQNPVMVQGMQNVQQSPTPVQPLGPTYMVVPNAAGQSQPTLVGNIPGQVSCQREPEKTEELQPKILNVFSMKEELQPKILNVCSVKDSDFNSESNEADNVQPDDADCVQPEEDYDSELTPHIDNSLICLNEGYCVISERDIRHGLAAYGRVTRKSNKSASLVVFTYLLAKVLETEGIRFPKPPQKGSKKQCADKDEDMSDGTIFAKVVDVAKILKLAITHEAVNLLCSFLRQIADVKPWLLSVLNLTKVLSFVQKCAMKTSNPSIFSQPASPHREYFWTCQVCGKQYRSEWTFVKHSNEHKRFLEAKTQEMAREHVFHHGNPSCCLFCKKSFTSASDFYGHFHWPCSKDVPKGISFVKGKVNNRGVAIAHKARAPAGSRPILDVILFNRNSAITVCCICMKECYFMEELRNHLSRHASMNEIQLVCSKCSINFQSDHVDFFDHVDLHKAGEYYCPITCPMCKLTFWFNDSMILHYRISHEGAPAPMMTSVSETTAAEKIGSKERKEKLGPRMIEPDVLEDLKEKSGNETSTVQLYAKGSERNKEGLCRQPAVKNISNPAIEVTKDEDIIDAKASERADGKSVAFKSGMEKRKAELELKKLALLLELKKRKEELKEIVAFKSRKKDTVSEELDSDNNADQVPNKVGKKGGQENEGKLEDTNTEEKQSHMLGGSGKLQRKRKQASPKQCVRKTRRSRSDLIKESRNVSENKSAELLPKAEESKKVKASLFKVIPDSSYLSQIGSFDEVMVSMRQGRNIETEMAKPGVSDPKTATEPFAVDSRGLRAEARVLRRRFQETQIPKPGVTSDGHMRTEPLQVDFSSVEPKVKVSRMTPVSVETNSKHGNKAASFERKTDLPGSTYSAAEVLHRPDLFKDLTGVCVRLERL